MLAFQSYRPRFGKDLVAKLRRQVTWSKEVDANSQQFLQLDLKATEVEQRRSRKRVNQQIDVAANAVLATCYRAEDARIGSAESRCGGTDRISFQVQRYGRVHGIRSQGMSFGS